MDWGQVLTPSSAWQIIKRVAHSLKLKGLVGPHMFRHYLAEDMLRSGTPLESVQAVRAMPTWPRSTPATGCSGPQPLERAAGFRHHAQTPAAGGKVYAPADIDQAREAVKRYRAGE